MEVEIGQISISIFCSNGSGNRAIFHFHLTGKSVNRITQFRQMEVEIGFNKLTSTSTSVSRDRACRVSGGSEVAPDFHGLPMHPALFPVVFLTA